VNEKCNNCNPPVVSFTPQKTESNKLQYENQSIAQGRLHPGGNHDRRRHYRSFGGYRDSQLCQSPHHFTAKRLHQ
jgi:hypothetical protein